MTGSNFTHPVAPPRRKRNKNRKLSTSSESQSIIGEISMKIPIIPPLSQSEINFQSTSSASAVTNTTKPPSVELVPETNEILSNSRILPSPATLHAITKEIENSFKESSSFE